MSDIKISQMEPWVGALTGNEEFPIVTANAQSTNYRVALSQITPSTLGFGSMALQNSNAVNITGGNVAVTALSGAITIANGGTGLGTTPTNGQLLIGNGSGYALSTLTAGSGVTITNGSGSITIAATNSGTVTSVGLDGGTTGITVSGANPITSSGTFTLGGVLNIANGGTGATTAAGARTAFGAAKSGANSDITSLSALTTPLTVSQGGTGSGTSLSGYIFGNGNNPFTSVAAIPMSDLTGTLPISKGGTNATTAAGARASILPSYSGNAGKALFINSGETDVEWKSVAGAGTVTSIDVSGGATGLTTSGGPIVTAGTITIGGTLAPTSGGTGITSFAVGDLLFANTTTSLDRLTVGTNGYLLASNGTAPAYVNPASVTVGSATTATTATSATSATTATNLAGGAGGSIPYQSVAGTTTFLASGTGVLAASGGNPAYTMSPSLTQVTVAGDPTLALQVATKQYVDTIATTSVHYHTPVKYEVPNTTGNLNATYNNGASGVGATLTNAGTLGAFTPDGIVASVGDRVLIYNQTNAAQNGVYTVTTVGNGSTPWVLTRATDANTYDPISPNALGGGDAFFVTSGNTGAGETYVCNNVGPITFGTTAISFVQVSATQVYSAGTGLTLTGTTFSLTAPVATSLGGTGLSSFTSGGAVYATSTSALTTGTLPVTAGGTGATSLTSGYLVKGNGTSAVSASVVYDDGTNVGIGTSSLDRRLSVYTTDATGKMALFANGNTNTNLYLSSDPSSGGAVINVSNNAASAALPLLFQGNGTERMRIDGSGRVGIGVTPATNRLVMARGQYLAWQNTGTLAEASGITADTSDNMVFFNNGSERARIDSSGNLLVGGTTAFGKITLQGNTNSDLDVWVRNDNAGSSARAGLVLNASGNSWRMGMGSSANNSNALTWNVDIGGANTERMRIDTSGNVGIGTSSPVTLLHVDNGTITSQRYSNSGAIILRRADGTQASPTAITANSVMAVMVARGYDGTAYRDTASVAFDSDGAISSTSSPGYIRFNTTPSGSTGTVERMRITSAGDVGIGGTPFGKLDIQGADGNTVFMRTTTSVQTGACINLKTNFSSSVPVYGFFYNGDTGLGNPAFQTASIITAGAERMRVTSAGDVGIGTSGPAKRLEVRGSGSNAAIRLKEDTSYGVSWDIDVGTTNQMLFTNNAGSALSYAFVNGAVGIGTASPSTYNGLLNVKGSDRAVIGYFGGTTYATRLGANSSYATVEAVDAATGVSSYQPLQICGSLVTLATGGTERMRIDSSGNLLVGTTSGTSKVTVSGTIESTTGGFKFPDGTTQTTAATGGGTGTVTSVAATVPTGFSISGSPITTSGTLAITFASGYSLPTTASQTNWDSVYTAWGSKTAPSGTVVGTTDTQTLTNKRIDPRDTSTTSASSLTPDISAADMYSYTALAAGLTINAPTGTPTNGDKIMFRFKDNGTSQTLTWNAAFRAIGVTIPTSTTAGKVTYVGTIYNAAESVWDVIAVTTQA